MRAVGCVVGAVVVAALLGGCSGSHGDLDATDSPVISYDWSEQLSLDALAFGKLSLVDGCLVISDDRTADSSLVAFPRKYAAWDSENQVLTYGGVAFHLGDTIAGGGGGTSNTEGLTIPAGCAAPVKDKVNVFLIMDKSIDPADYPQLQRFIVP